MITILQTNSIKLQLFVQIPISQVWIFFGNFVSYFLFVEIHQRANVIYCSWNQYYSLNQCYSQIFHWYFWWKQSFTRRQLHVPLFVHFHHEIWPTLWTFSDEFADKFVHKVEAIVTLFPIERPAFPSWLPLYFVNNPLHSIPFHLEVFAFVVKNVFAVEDCSPIQPLTF